MKNLLYIFIIAAYTACTPAISGDELLMSEKILINQVGYYPGAPKIAVVKSELEQMDFYVITSNLADTAFSGKLSGPRKSAYSGATTYIADFSALKTKGEYVLVVPELGKSGPIKIKTNAHREVAQAAIKGYYFQRASYALLPEYASTWARPAGHPDTEVYVHSSAISEGRPEEFLISATKGWYDAGDYNKYIVNSGITMGTLFSLYEDFPDFMDELDLQIPESGNELPDLLDEALYNLRWMLTMQDPYDGGVYHKLTTAEFEGMIKPVEAKGKRYVVQKSTTATLDFAAVMTQASRIFKGLELQVPGLADSCMNAAVHAWSWAVKNPDKIYDQNKNNEKFYPPVNTGAYDDKNVTDEFIWAGIELFITTGNKEYLQKINLDKEGSLDVPSWPNVETMGYFSLIRHHEKVNDDQLVNLTRKKMISLADDLLKKSENNAYSAVIGGTKSDYVWGSNAIAANQGIVLLYAYKLTGEKKYLDHALNNLDYLLGRNATGYSFVTGYGYKYPKFIHHRPSESDGIEEPVPGLLAGGPNPHQQDKCEYPFDAADESYIDEVCSYASNEICINWNAPLVYLATALEALQDDFSKERM